MTSACALLRQMFLVLLEYCSFFKVVLQYQYQSFSIVLKYKTARLVHPCHQHPPFYRGVFVPKRYVLLLPDQLQGEEEEEEGRKEDRQEDRQAEGDDGWVTVSGFKIRR